MRAPGRSATAVLTAVLAASALTTGTASAATRYDRFTSLDDDVWMCEYTCPTVSGDVAAFELRPGVPADRAGSWSKIGYEPNRFTKGRFTIRFSLSERPEDNPVWWGLALWDDGPEPGRHNEINFGYTTDQSFTNTQLRFESTKRGKESSIKVDTGVDLYDGRFHTGTLEYDSEPGSAYVAFYLDDRLLQVIDDESVVPTDPVELVVGARLVTGGAPLSEPFVQTVDWVKIEE